jgi:hypothetical protein
MPGRESFKSAEWAVINEAIAAAVSENNRGLRDDLREFRTDIKADLGGLRGDVGKMQVQLSQGDGMFKLMDQRVKWLEDDHERERAAAERNGLMGDTSRIAKVLADAKARDKTSDDSGKRYKDDKDRLLISPKVINAFILAFVAAAGASIWAVLQHAFSPPDPAPAAVAPSTHPAVARPADPGTATGP